MSDPSQGGVLIITEKFDPHADHVIGALRQRGVPFFRLNTDDFHADMQVAASTEDGTIRLADRWGRSHLYPAATRAVWHRKPIDPAPPAAIAEPTARQIVLQETLEFLSYPSAMAGVGDAGPRWINNPFDNQRAQRKFPQLRLARALGLRVPRSIITNDPAQARAFYQAVDGNLLCKSMKAHGYARADAEFFIFSRRVSAAEFDAHAEALVHCPSLLQEYIAKDHELRITIFGDQVFCCRIDSQTVTGAETDWRRVDPFTVPHRIVPLDPGIEAALRQMMGHYNLAYGAFDMIVTEAGEYVFLELNPNGQWLWIELITGAPMTAAMTALLLG